MQLAQGEFSFAKYKPGDGIVAGDYVIVFAQLMLNRSDGIYQGPDALTNLYNDPDKNGTNPEFSIKHEAPGKSNYVFNLAVAGQEAVSEPGPRSVTTIPNE